MRCNCIGEASNSISVSFKGYCRESRQLYLSLEGELIWWVGALALNCTDSFVPLSRPQSTAISLWYFLKIPEDVLTANTTKKHTHKNARTHSMPSVFSCFFLCDLGLLILKRGVQVASSVEQRKPVVVCSLYIASCSHCLYSLKWFTTPVILPATTRSQATLCHLPGCHGTCVYNMFMTREFLNV